MIEAGSSMQKSTRKSLPVFIVVALLFFGAAAFMIPMYMEELSTVAKSSIPGEGKDGPLRAWGAFRPDGINPLPPCIVKWKSGKNYNFRSFHGENVVTFDNGQTLRLKERQALEFFQNSQPIRPRKSDAETEKADAYFRQEHSDTSYSFLHCLSETERVWIEGCVRNGHIAGCGGPKSEVTITPGGPELRRRYILIHAFGVLALILLGAGAICIGLIEQFRYSGRLLDEFARRRTGRMPGDTTVSFAAAGGVICALTLFTWPSLPGPIVTLLGAIVTIGILFTEAIRRWRVLGAARDYLDSKVTAPLHSPPGSAQEWAVQVPPNAPMHEGFYVGSSHALVQFEIVEHYVEEVAGKRVKRERQVAKSNVPQGLAIVDASGPGVLETTYCIIEAQKMPNIALSYASHSPSWFAEINRALPRAPIHEGYVIQWSVIEPGDLLFIHGEAGRIRSDTAGSSMPAGYRGPPEVPLIRGTTGTSAIVHLGEKSKLRSGIAAELRAHVIGLILVVLGLGTSIAIGAWIGQQI